MRAIREDPRKAKNPEELINLILAHLSPPLYAAEELQGLNRLYICAYCKNTRVDICFVCHANICDDHAKVIATIHGKPLRFDWRHCNPGHDLLGEKWFDDLLKDDRYLKKKVDDLGAVPMLEALLN